MAVVPIQDATRTFDCRTPNCLGEAKANRGTYAYLCDPCKQRKRERHEEERASNVHLLRPAVDGFEAKAKSLVAVGKQLDKAVAVYKAKQASIEPAKSALDEAMLAWRNACRDLAGDSAAVA